MKQSNPLARKESLIIKELDGETLIYDLERDKAHCLNSTAALVWNNCDGMTTVAQLRELIEENAGSPVPEEVAWLALQQLEKFKLLATPVKEPSHFSGMSRRQMMRLVGTAAIAAPIITSILAPPPAQAATLLPPGSCCNSPGQCASGSCVQGGPCAVTPSSKSCT
ncbi:MAG: PqqD family protein [Acidobacteriota bacterium]